MSSEFNPKEFYSTYPQKVISRPGYPARAAYKSWLLWKLYGKQVQQSLGEIKQYADIGGCFGFGANALSYHIAKSQKNNPETHVFEISEDFIRIGEELFPRLHFHSEAFELWNGNPQNFDLVSLFDLVEHLPDPKPLLKSVASRSKFVLLKTPLETTGKWRGSRPPHKKGKDHPDGHVQFFTQKYYESLLSECGLKVLKFKIVRSIIPKGSENILNPEKDKPSGFNPKVLAWWVLYQIPFPIARKIIGQGDHLSLCKSMLV